jgi:hypothetical protein
MALEQIVALLIEERDRLNKAIEALTGPTKRRGRPPKAESVASHVAAPRPRNLSAATRKAQSERMKKYWAAKRRAKPAPR